MVDVEVVKKLRRETTGLHEEQRCDEQQPHKLDVCT
jgi:hypothetical protein